MLSVFASRAVDGQENDKRFLPLTRDQIVQQGEQPIGTFTHTIDEVHRLYRGEKFGLALPGEDALSNETLSSYSAASVTVEFLDGTKLTVGPNSEVILDEFVYDPGANKGKMSLNILSGIVKFVSGYMSSDSYSIKTPSGMAAIRGTELVFLVEPDGDVSVGVFSGGVSFSTQDQNFVAEENNLSENFLTFKVDAGGAVNGEIGAMRESFSQVELVFEGPEIYSTFVAAYKTEQYKDKIISACTKRESCQNVVLELVSELAELGVDRYDVLTSLGEIKQVMEESGLEETVVQQSVDIIQDVEAEVAVNYEPVIKVSETEQDDEQTEVEGAGDLEEDTSSIPPPLLTPIVPPLVPDPDNQAPTDIQLSANSIFENAQSLEIGVLSSSDDYTSSNAMVFELLPNGSNQDHLAFSIDPITRILSLNQQPDYETKSSFSIQVRATDEEGLSFTKNFIITIEDVNEGPSVTVLYPPLRVVMGNVGLGSGQVEPSSLTNYAAISDPEGDDITVSLTSADNLSVTPATPSGILSGTYEAVSVGQSGAHWQAQTAHFYLNAEDAMGNTTTAELPVIGELLIGSGDLPLNTSLLVEGVDGDDVVGGFAGESGVIGPDPISDIGQGIDVEAHFYLGGGNNTVYLGDDVARDHGYVNLVATGQTGNYHMTLGDRLGSAEGAAYIDMTFSDTAVTSVGNGAANENGYFQYVAGPGTNTITAGSDFGTGGFVNFFMSHGAANSLTAQDNAAKSGSLFYYGGDGADALSFEDSLANSNGVANFDMQAGGTNSITALEGAGRNGTLNYTGGPQADTLNFGSDVAYAGAVHIDHSAGGSNTFTGLGFSAIAGTITYLGGTGADSFTLGVEAAAYNGMIAVDVRAGGHNVFNFGDAAAFQGGTITYEGGAGKDELQFGHGAGRDGAISIDLGADSSVDKVSFLGNIGDQEGSVTIQNYNFNDDSIELPFGITATATEIIDGGGNLTWTELIGNHSITFTGIGSGGSGVTATPIQLADSMD